MTNQLAVSTLLAWYEKNMGKINVSLFKQQIEKYANMLLSVGLGWCLFLLTCSGILYTYKVSQLFTYRDSSSKTRQGTMVNEIVMNGQVKVKLIQKIIGITHNYQITQERISDISQTCIIPGWYYIMLQENCYYTNIKHRLRCRPTTGWSTPCKMNSSREKCKRPFFCGFILLWLWHFFLLASCNTFTYFPGCFFNVTGVVAKTLSFTDGKWMINQI